MSFGALFSLRRLLAIVGRDASRVAAVALGLCAIAVVWASILASLSAQRAEALRGTALNAENLARAFEENILRTFSSLDQSLRSLRRAYVRNQPNFDINEWATSTRAMTDMTVQFAVTDKYGVVKTGTLTAPNERVDLRSRAHFRALSHSPNDDFFIGEPVVGQSSHIKVVVVARKLLSPDGSFNGIVLASLDIDYLARFYRSVDIGRLGIVRLVGQDGVVRVRAGGRPEDDLAAIGQRTTTHNLLAHFARASAGIFTAPSQTDGITRIFAYRGTRGFPLIVQVGITESEALERFYEDARSQYVLGGVVTFLAAVVMAMYLLRDTQLKRARDDAEARYAYKARLLERTVANISQGILVVGADNKVQVYNQRLLDLLDLPDDVATPHQPLEQMLHWLWTHGEFEDGGDDFGTWLASFLAVLRNPAATPSYEHTRPNGVMLDVRTALLPDGGVVRSYTDITDSKLEAQLLQAAREGAARATEAKSAFLATMSHEIRSPLGGLLGVLDLLRATPLDVEQSRMASMIHNSGKLLLSVLNDILDFSKIEAGALSVTPEPADLHALLTEAVQPYVQPGHDRGIAVSLSIDGAVPRIAMTDRMRVAQIVGNLLSNAMKFTAAGSITVHAVTICEDPSAPAIRVTVRDTGIGMEAGTVSRLFKPFSQADGSITRKFGGTGLGLCISQQLARLLGGAITVTSRAGEGSAFSLTLPWIACAQQDIVHAAPEEPAAGEEFGAGLRVLLVDDDPTNRWLGQSQLRRLGFAVDVAEDGEAGLAAIRAARYDVLVTDLHMPRLCGVGLTEAVRGDAELAWRTLPIIGLTADTTDEQRARCRLAGMTEFIIKPITVARLEALLVRVLPKFRDESAPPPEPPPPADAPRGLLPIPFDPHIYLEMLPRGDPAGATWLRDYLETAREDVEMLCALRISASSPGGSPQADPALVEISSVAHRLAGASFSVGATLLGQAARAVEHAAHRDPPPALPPLLEALQSQFADATTAIESFLFDDQPSHVHADLPAA
jgi:signal transduction histidine kinase/ActR/RegA family two-component response regulator/HPt (histidine-containing phosphotransfer) domain-containing protein